MKTGTAAKSKSQGLAIVLSLLLPGLGQLYNGEVAKGLCFLALEVVLVLSGIYPLLILLLLGASIEASHGAHRANTSV